MALAKDSCFIEINATDDGYFIRVHKWDVSPPPRPYRDLDAGEIPTTFRTDRIANDKVELKAKLAQFFDAVFDVV